MAILIKGMEMPKNGYVDIRICYDGTIHRHIGFGDYNVMKGKEAVELPPHGRLIDADALLQHEVAIPSDGGYLRVIYSSYVRNAPTIIEAEDSFFNSLKRGLEQAINDDVREMTIIESDGEHDGTIC